MNDLETRKKILLEIFPDSILKEDKKEIITWCNLKCAGLHHKRKLQINYEKNIYHCWVCGSSSFITKLLRECASKSRRKRYLDTIDDLRHQEEPEEFRLEPPPHTQFLLDALDVPDAMRAYEWLREKTGVSDEDIFQHKIGFCNDGDYRSRLIFPSFSVDGHLNFFVTRSVWRADTWKYLNCSGVKSKDVIYNEILVNWNKPIIIVEGIKTYLKHLAIENVVPILGSRFTKDYLLFKRSILNDVPLVYVALDDTAKAKSYEIMELYDSYEVEARLVDVSDVIQPDEFDTESFVGRLEAATKFSRKNSLEAQIERVRRSL